MRKLGEISIGLENDGRWRVTVENEIGDTNNAWGASVAEALSFIAPGLAVAHDRASLDRWAAFQAGWKAYTSPRHRGSMSAAEDVLEAFNAWLHGDKP